MAFTLPGSPSPLASAHQVDVNHFNSASLTGNSNRCDSFRFDEVVAKSRISYHYFKNWNWTVWFKYWDRRRRWLSSRCTRCHPFGYPAAAWRSRPWFGCRCGIFQFLPFNYDRLVPTVATFHHGPASSRSAGSVATGGRTTSTKCPSTGSKKYFTLSNADQNETWTGTARPIRVIPTATWTLLINFQ